MIYLRRYERMHVEVDVAKDFLDEIIRDRTKRNPQFPELVEAATRTRALIRSLADLRQKLGLSQTLVAARMGTSQPSLARMESGEVDPRMSTVERYALAIGRELSTKPASGQ